MPGLVSRTPFVGRQRELAILLDRLEEAASGKGGVVLVGGEPGVGKTRLVQELASLASAQNWLVLHGRAYDLDIVPPYLPISEAMTTHVQTVAEVDLREQLGECAADVALIVPAVRDRLPDLALRPAVEPGEDRFRFFESVAAFLLNIARVAPGGLLLILDDLHWADQPTLQLAVHLARRLAAAPLLMLATYRTVALERATSVRDALAELSREGLAGHLVLGPLAVADVATLLEMSWGAATPREAAEALYHKTEGNPFFAREIIQHLQAEGCDLERLPASLRELRVPEGVRQVIGRRLARLSPAANRLLEACAVLGDGVSFDVLATVCDEEDETILHALDEAVAAGMVREESETYHLSHALVRQTINERLLAPRKRRLHLRAAETIEQIHADNLDSFVNSLVTHYALAGPASTEQALAWAERAAECASAVFAWEAASRHLESALGLVEGRTGDRWLERRAGLLRRLGRLLFESGLDSRSALGHLEEAIGLYERLGRTVDAAEAHVRLGHAYAGGAVEIDIPRALHHLQIAEQTLSDQPASTTQGELYHALGVAALTGVRTGEGLAASWRALSIAEVLNSDTVLARASVVNGAHLFASGQIAGGLDRLELGWEAACRDQHVYMLQIYGSTPSDFLREIGASMEAHLWAERSLKELTKNRASPALLRNPLCRVGRAKIAAGDIGAARRLLDEVEGEGDTFQRALLTAHLAVAEGDWARAEAVAGMVRDRCRLSGYRQGGWYALQVLALSHRARGDRQGAEELLREALALSLDGGRVPFELANRAGLAILAAEGGRLDDPESHLARCRQILAAGEDWRGLAGRVDLAEAVQLTSSGRMEDAGCCFERALAVFRRNALPWDEAEALQLWGAVLAAAGERGGAAGKLVAARVIYARIGAGAPWLESIAALERRLSPDRRAELRYPDGLTAREVDVLRLLAAGESNREIAARFVLSTRTVERHVASIYGKIGARGRADATAYVIRHGLDRVLTP